MIVMKYRTELDAQGKVTLITDSTETYCLERDNCLRTTQDCVELLNDCLRLAWQTEEVVYLLALDCRCQLISVCEISHGTVSESPLSPREVYMKALLGASCIIVAYNHPSGDPFPSLDDLYTLYRLRSAGELLGVGLEDFIIIGREGRYYSTYDGIVTE